MKKKLSLLIIALSIINLGYSQIIDIIGTGMIGKGNENIPLTDINNIDQIYVGAFSKDNDDRDDLPNPADVNFRSNGILRSTLNSENASNLNFEVKYRANRTDTGSFAYFDATFNSFNANGVNIFVSAEERDHLHSYYAFIYKTVPNATHKSFINSKNVALYQNGVNDPFVYNIPINTATSSRNINVKIPISEIDPPGRDRELIINITAGSITRQKIITSYDESAGESFLLIEEMLNNVPGNVNNVNVSIYSPFTENESNGGQSAFISGVVVDVDINCIGSMVNAGENQTVTINNSVDEGSTILRATASGGNGFTYLWNTGATTASITVSPQQTTTYTVTATSNEGCVSRDTVIINVIDCASAAVNAGEDQTVTINNLTDQGSTTLRAIASGGSGFTYLWSTGATTASITVSPQQTTNYTVTATSNEGCVTSDAVIVNVIDCATAVVNAGEDQTVTINNLTDQGNTTLRAIASGGSGFTYLWSTGATTASIQVSPQQTTTYTVTATSNEGCVSRDTVVINVIDCIGVTVDAGEDQVAFIYEPPTTEACVNLTATTGGDSNVSYLWSTGETTASIEVCPTKTVIYTVTITTKGGCIATDTVVVSVKDVNGAYCCDDINLVSNGNFEFGDKRFTSEYTQTESTYPGEYTITNTAVAFGASITDHSVCEDPITYHNNGTFMVINGKTQQKGNSVVWKQKLKNLDKGKSYKFCANFKNMKQCTFDILPVIYMSSGNNTSDAQTINTTIDDPCDWQNVVFNFIATGKNQTIKIILDETGNGDGNDLAIDDIFVGSIDPNLAITVQNDGTSSQIKGSLNTINLEDDTLHGNGKCNDYYWYVTESTTFPQITIDWNTFAKGNSNGSLLPPSSSVSGAPWNLTTTFPGYSFEDNKLYVVGMYTPECGCFSQAHTYQLTFNTSSGGNIPVSPGLERSSKTIVELPEPELTETQELEIIDAIINGLEIDNTFSITSTIDIEVNENSLNIYPSPAKDLITVELSNNFINSIEIINNIGQTVFTAVSEGKNNKKVINVNELQTGIYYLKIKGTDNANYIKKFAKE